jgi:streptomycin 6-kinase
MHRQFIQNARDRGEEGATWLKRIPDLVRRAEHKWSISAGRPFELSYNYVAPAKMRDGTPVVLKIGFPGDKEFQSEINSLLVFNGNGLVRLLEYERDYSTMLLERIEPGSSLEDIQDDAEATRVLASVARMIHRPLTEIHNFPSVAEWFKGFRRLRDAFDGTTGPLPSRIVEEAEELYEELIATMTRPGLIHGDLHHGNVLCGTRELWIAIDPKGVVAEPAFETAAMLRNPYSRVEQSTNLYQLLDGRINILSGELEIEPERIRKWGFAQTVLSAIWHIEDHGMGWEFPMAVAAVLRTIRL